MGKKFQVLSIVRKSRAYIKKESDAYQKELDVYQKESDAYQEKADVYQEKRGVCRYYKKRQRAKQKSIRNARLL